MGNTHEHLYSVDSHPDGLRKAQIWHDIAAIGESIDLTRIRTQETQGKPSERWGVMWVEELPLIFRAWKVSERSIAVVDGADRTKTTWYPHAPYHPQRFTVPHQSEPLSSSEQAFVLEGLGVSKEQITKASEEGITQTLFHETLAAKKEEYAALDAKLKSDPTFRGVVSAAISLTCEEVDRLSPKE